MRSIKFNFIMNILLTVSSIIFPMITFPYVSRILHAEGLGKVNFSNSVITYFSMIAQLGIPTYGIRACAQVKENKEKLSKTVHEILAINFVMTIVSYILFFISLHFVDKFREDFVLLMVTSVTMIFNTLGIQWLYSALEQYSYITIRSLVFKVISIIAMLLFVRKETDYVIYAGITVLAQVGSNVINLIHSKKYILWHSLLNYDLRKHIGPIIVFFSMSIATTVYTSLDTVMLGFMKSDEEVGYYSAAVKIRLVLLGIVNSLATVLLPRASAYIQKGMKKEFIKISKKAFEFVVIVGCSFWIYFSLYAKESILLISGSSYLSAIRPMQFIMPTVLICGLSNLVGIQMLVPLGKEKTVLISQMAGAVIDFSLNLAFIPKYGAESAALATMIAELAILLIQLHKIKKERVSIYKGFRAYKILIAISVAVICSVWIKFIHINTFWSLMISAILYFGTYFFILILLKERLVIEIFNYLLDKVRSIIKFLTI